MEFENSYEDTTRAEAYSKLEFEGTYYLAYRDLPEIYAKHSKGQRAVDFGCGTGRSTRFLREHGYAPIGIDISPDMLEVARKADTGGDYRLVKNGEYDSLGVGLYDLITAIFTLDNVPGVDTRKNILEGLRRLLADDGVIVLLDSTPEMYVNEWASFSTKDFPENRNAKSGDTVPIVTTDIADARPCFDIFWLDSDYKELFAAVGLKLLGEYRPLGRADEQQPWVNETRIAPWVIYVAGKK